jgi:hypothetical protein
MLWVENGWLAGKVSNYEGFTKSQMNFTNTEKDNLMNM